MARIITGHKTPILKGIDSSDIAPLTAAERYHAFAQEQLAFAAAQEMGGSMALYGLGKIAVQANGSKSQQMAAKSQAIAFYKAAMIAESNNYLAANELGVLLAEKGELEPARDLLARSVALSPSAASWQNLSVVHARMKQQKLAEEARAHAVALGQIAGPTTSAAVEWVDPVTFVSLTPAMDGLGPSIPSTTPASSSAKKPAQPAKPPQSAAKPGIFDRLSMPLRRTQKAASP